MIVSTPDTAASPGMPRPRANALEIVAANNWSIAGLLVCFAQSDPLWGCKQIHNRDCGQISSLWTDVRGI